jgi:serine/threonine-protein kinase 24/25/MST4
MADEGVAEHYQVLEELGRKYHEREYLSTLADGILGGSFGVVYKGIEKATGETVAIKHVSPSLIISVARYTS